MITPVSWRPAGAADAFALAEVERVANLEALAHVFDPLRHPFPFDDVLARWALVLQDPEVRVEAVGGEQGLLACTAYDQENLRHLFVHPQRWGTGLGRDGVARAVAHIRGLDGTPHLWCLEENRRARGLYEHLGWCPTGVTREAVWPPHPVEMEYSLTWS
ncbi:GNAT family N-acetyltransferase [Nocardioides houyundeii]|uniref:GNAT family N-acetyltransferase n=1 Tax=Nocardioides houyundeii TaxID=2045452 RepID=UPI000DF391FF|nr:GNAT family N-acetyltransferase [Nocardioides houyundeii]